jgi:hypothetical protein
MTKLRIFVSYNATDAVFATQLITDLRHTEVEVITASTEAVEIEQGANPTPPDLDDTAFEEVVAEKLPQCQHLIVIQTPAALQSRRVQTVVDAALKQVQAGQMKEVLRVIAPMPNGAQTQTVPPGWANTPEFDASQDYPRALARLCLHLGLGTNEVHDVPPPPASSIAPLVLLDPNEIGKKSPVSEPSHAQTPGGIDHPSRPHRYPSDPNGTEKQSAVAGGTLQAQRSAGEDRPLRALRYPRLKLRRRLFFLSLAMMLVLVVAGVTVFIDRSLTHGQSLPNTSKPTSTSTSIVAIHTPIPTATQQQLQPTPTPAPTPTPTPQSPATTPMPQPPTPTPRPIPTPTPQPIPPHVPCTSQPNDTNCTGQDPVNQGCDKDAFTVNGATAYIKGSNGNNIGQVELRFSTVCQSNWARTTVYNTCGYTNIYANIQRPDQIYQGKEYVAAQDSFTINNPGCQSNLQVFTNIVYAPGTVKAEACGSVQGSSLACTILI